MNFKDLSTKKRFTDSDKAERLRLSAKRCMSDSQRVADMRSGGSGSLRSSLFGRKDEVVTQEMEDDFREQVEDMILDYDIWDINATEYKGKQVMEFYVQFPDKVSMGGGKVDALLAKVDYNKDTRTFTALYRPKDGKWGQANATGKKINKLGEH